MKGGESTKKDYTPEPEAMVRDQYDFSPTLTQPPPGRGTYEHGSGEEVIPSGTWRLKALCRGKYEIFYPPREKESKDEKLRREGVAKSFCVHCVVREECLEYAITHKEPAGVWGGFNEAERKEIKLPLVQVVAS